MILYHVTDETRLASILTQGIVPDAGSNFEGGFTSLDGFVYLTPALDWRYAIMSCGSAYPGNEGGLLPRPVLIEVNVGGEHLYPDEDHLRDDLVRNHGWSAERVEQEVGVEYVRHNCGRWRESLERSGTAAHDGPIGLVQVRGALIVDHELMAELMTIMGCMPHLSANRVYDGPHGRFCQKVHRWAWGESAKDFDVPCHIEMDGTYHGLFDLPRVAKGNRRIITLKRGNVVNDVAA